MLLMDILVIVDILRREVGVPNLSESSQPFLIDNSERVWERTTAMVCPNLCWQRRRRWNGWSYKGCHTCSSMLDSFLPALPCLPTVYLASMLVLV